MYRLQTMIHSLRELSAEIASKLLNRRLERQPDVVDSTPGIPIKDLMAARMAELAESPDQADEAADAVEPVRPAVPDAHPLKNPNAKKKAPWQAVTGVFSALAHRFAGHRGQAKLEPFMAEKMRRNALDHVNKALALARKGNAQGAQIHVELAESAMETAADYMSDDELADLRETIEARLHPTKTPSSSD